MGQSTLKNREGIKCVSNEGKVRSDSPEVGKDEGLHHLRQQHHHRPDSGAQRLQERHITDASCIERGEE